uniref:Uncharacterized protein n=1 Tax=Sphaerodactylus townsendi TaxID=933632 RepID=A0ACB8EF27_9SAUR
MLMECETLHNGKTENRIGCFAIKSWWINDQWEVGGKYSSEEADTDDNQGTLDFDEFCAFYKMMSTRRDLYLLMLSYSNHKDYLDIDDLKRFLEAEQKTTLSGIKNIRLTARSCAGKTKSWWDFVLELQG